jgi:hypothetical protein
MTIPETVTAAELRAMSVTLRDESNAAKDAVRDYPNELSRSRRYAMQQVAISLAVASSTLSSAAEDLDNLEDTR